MLRRAILQDEIFKALFRIGKGSWLGKCVYLPVYVVMLVNGLQGKYSLSNVESGLVHCQNVFTHQECLQEI